MAATITVPAPYTTSRDTTGADPGVRIREDIRAAAVEVVKACQALSAAGLDADAAETAWFPKHGSIWQPLSSGIDPELWGV